MKSAVGFLFICAALFLFIFATCKFWDALGASFSQKSTLQRKLRAAKNLFFPPKPPVPQLISSDVPELRNILFVSILELLSGINAYYMVNRYKRGANNVFYYAVNHLEYGQKCLLKQYITDNYCKDKDSAIQDIWWSLDLTNGRKNTAEDYITPQQAEILCIRLWD